jgi:hypothetical protein
MPDGGNAEGGGHRIIGGLAVVAVVDRVNQLILAAGMAHQLQRTVGDNLVHIHVEGGARPALERVNRKLIEQSAAGNLFCSRLKGPTDFGRNQAQVGVGPGRCHLHIGQGPNPVGMDGTPCHSEVLGGAQGMNAPVDALRHFPHTQGVMLGSGHADHL